MTTEQQNTAPLEHEAKQAEEAKEARAKRVEDSRALLAKLAEAYPKIFPHPKDGRPVALAIGLHKELQPIVKEWGFSPATLRSALAWYTKQLRYQNAVLHATHRTNLDGSDAEEILEEHKTLAKENIAKIEAWLSENRPDALKRTEPKKRTQKPRRQGQAKRRPNNNAGRNDKAAGKSAPANTQTLDEKMQSLLDKFNQ